MTESIPPTLTIDLRGMDGHIFEDEMFNLYTALGYRVEMGPRVNDEGRDLIIHDRQGVIVAECKRYEKKIGRPIIQKLHSALLTYGTNRGMCITSSSFSEQATEYAVKVSEHGEEITLINGAALKTLGRTVGFNYLVDDGGIESALIYDCRKPAPLDDLKKIFQLKPKTLSNLEIKCQQKDVSALYIEASARYTMHYLGRKEVCKEQEMKLIANGIEITGSKAKQMSNSGKICLNAPDPIPQCEIKRQSQALEASFENKQVNYTGRNGQSYSKTFNPSASSRYKQIVLSVYQFVVHSGPHSIEITNIPEIGYKHNGRDLKRVIICNDCGRMCKDSAYPFGICDGTFCENCGKTLCSFHTRIIGPWLSNKKKICSPCALRLQPSYLKPILAAISGILLLIGGSFFSLWCICGIPLLLTALFLGTKRSESNLLNLQDSLKKYRESWVSRETNECKDGWSSGWEERK